MFDYTIFTNDKNYLFDLLKDFSDENVDEVALQIGCIKTLKNNDNINIINYLFTLEDDSVYDKLWNTFSCDYDGYNYYTEEMDKNVLVPQAVKFLDERFKAYNEPFIIDKLYAPIETQQLVLRKFVRDDIGIFNKHFAEDSDIEEHYYIRENNVSERIGRLRKLVRFPNTYTITKKDTQEIIGLIRIQLLEEVLCLGLPGCSNACYLEMYIFKEYYHYNYAIEAANALIEKAFDNKTVKYVETKADVFEAKYYPINLIKCSYYNNDTFSKALLEYLDFKYTGYDYHNICNCKEVPITEYFYYLTKDMYAKKQNKHQTTLNNKNNKIEFNDKNGNASFEIEVNDSQDDDKLA